MRFTSLEHYRFIFLKHKTAYELRMSDGSSDVCSSDLANELDIAQPTASHSLASLRRVLDDPLLVRAGGEMEPTPRALAIAPTIAQLLELKRELSTAEQNPATRRRKRDRKSVV